jgi:hypothetical protein
MKKFLLVSMIVATASLSVFATDLKLSGDMYARGTTVDNQALVKSDKTNYSYFDYDLNLKAALVVNEQATVFVKLTFDGPTAQTVPNGSVGNNAGQGLTVENAFVQYKFNTGTTAEVGIMPGNKWGTSFADTETNPMRVKLVQAIGSDVSLFLIYQKNRESGAKAGAPNAYGNVLVSPNTTGKDAEKDDSTTYYLASIMKFGALKFSPLVAYTLDGRNQAATETGAYYLKTYTADIALAGDFGVLGFEAEYRFDKVKNGISDGVDKQVWGAYGNIFAKIDTFKVGFLYAYASADQTKGIFGMGDDFNAAIVADEINADGLGLSGVTVYKIYAEAAFNPITVGLGVAYVTNNVDWIPATKDTTYTEIDASVAYAIDAATAYTIDGGYLMAKDSPKGTDANEWAIRHKISIKF